MSVWIDAYEELSEYFYLKDHWDGYDANRISDEALSSAISTLLYLWGVAVLSGTEGIAIYPAPGADGSVDLELETKDRTVIFEFNGTEDFGIYLEDRNPTSLNDTGLSSITSEKTVTYGLDEVSSSFQWLTNKD